MVHQAMVYKTLVLLMGNCQLTDMAIVSITCLSNKANEMVSGMFIRMILSKYKEKTYDWRNCISYHTFWHRAFFA